MKQRIVIFLQNAWSPVYAGRKWPRESWLRALDSSISGQRLKIMVDDLSVCHNTTEEVSPSSGGVCDADPVHIRNVLEKVRPDVVICCGIQASESVRPLWAGPILCVPHPASQVLTDDLYKHARLLLARGHKERTRIIQMPYAIKTEIL